ncbi:MAG TPA: TonB-dependent receptor plug domain-containing protein [Woeseiaceae bacterium]
MSAAGIGTCLPITSALAQQNQDNAEPLEEIVVTGSIIKRAEVATASPVTVLSAEELELRGINTIADAVTLLPANNAGTINSSWSTFGFTSGASAVSLRGLTTSSSLTTFDGLRMAPYPLGDDGRRNFVDLGTIPDSIIERVEVLKDGASSTYGADAIAGVVNVITNHRDVLVSGAERELPRPRLRPGHRSQTCVNDAIPKRAGHEIAVARMAGSHGKPVVRGLAGSLRPC